VIKEYKYENILTLVTYYQMVGVATASHELIGYSIGNQNIAAYAATTDVWFAV